MKKSIILWITVVGLITLFSCEKELRDPKLDMSQAVSAQISAPANGSAFLLEKGIADSILATFTWSETVYNLADLEETIYTLQMDSAGADFSDPYELVTTTETSYTITVGTMNNLLLALGYPAGAESPMEFRVRSIKNDVTVVTEVFSTVTTLQFTPYEDLIIVNPIYLLGDATLAGWDNTLAIEMAYLDGGRFARVEYLNAEAGDWFKFLADLGAWAPQWGTDATGTPESGPLVYRPDEATPDPLSIPVPLITGNYYIEVDTALLTYKTFPSAGTLFLLGSATTVGWDNMAALPFTEVEPHVFEITTTLIDGGMKFIEVIGQWAPQWGTNASATDEGGRLVFRPNESVTDPAEIPSPGSGTFKIRADLTKISYTIEPQ